MFQQLADSLVHSFPSLPFLPHLALARAGGRTDGRHREGERASSSRAGSIIKRREGAPFAAKVGDGGGIAFISNGRTDGRTD